VLFDLDGVLTSTTELHIDCWKRTFDPLLAQWGQAPFDAQREYAEHVDGKPRADGVRDFLRSRGAILPEERIVAIGDAKQALVERALERDGVRAFEGSERWVRQLRARGIRTAVVSSSANAPQVLRAAGIDDAFDAVVDGGEVARLGLRGKPAPDGFVEAARRLGVRPRRAAVVEDALAGVEAGRAGALRARHRRGPQRRPRRAARRRRPRRRRRSRGAGGMSWLIEDSRHSPALESVFAVGNGYLGVRGAPEEGSPAYDAGTVLNGFYESWPIVYPEDAYGLARTGQTIVAPPDGSVVRLLVDGEPVDVGAARVTRVLDMRAGVLRRELELDTPGGARLRVRSSRLASLVRRNLVAIDYEVEVLDGAAHVAVCSELRPHEEAAATTTPAATRASPSARSSRWRPRRSARASCSRSPPAAQSSRSPAGCTTTSPAPRRWRRASTVRPRA
jgi:alpha,alpha-trehalose phosphorylase